MDHHDAERRDSYPPYLDKGPALGMDGLSTVRHAARWGWGLSVPASSAPAVPLKEEEIDWARRFLEEGIREYGAAEMMRASSPDRVHL